MSVAILSGVERDPLGAVARLVTTYLEAGNILFALKRYAYSSLGEIGSPVSETYFMTNQGEASSELNPDIVVCLFNVRIRTQ